MYRIIGADQVEYGPVTAEQIREWIREGRARASTLAEVAGQPGWRPLSGFPEFADALKSRRPPPVAAGTTSPPPRVATEIDPSLAPLAERDYRLDMGKYFSQGWKLILDNFWLLVGSTALVTLIMAGLESLAIIGQIAGTLLLGVFGGGLYVIFLKRVRGQATTVGDAFCAFNYALLPAAVAGTLWQLLTLVGLFLCIAPGVYVFVSWIFALHLVMDKRLDFWPAMELSRKVVHRHWWQMFLFVMLLVIIGLAGLIAFVIGVFITMALATAALTYAYEDLFGPGGQLTAALPQPAAANQQTEAPPPAPPASAPAL